MGRTNLQDLSVLEVNLDNPTHEETLEQQRMVDELLLDQMCDDYAEADMQRKYATFLKAVKDSGVNVERIFENIPVKKRHLREIMGYPALKGKEGEPVLLDNAKHARIGKAYLDLYNRARQISHS